MDNKENTGAIFKNNFKSKETQPDYRGEINVDGKDHSIALWFKKAKNEKETPYFSVSIGEPYRPDVQSQDNSAPPPPSDVPPF